EVCPDPLYVLGAGKEACRYRGHEGPEDAHEGRDGYEDRHDQHRRDEFGHDEEGRRVDTHDLHGVDVLLLAHAADLRGHVGAHLAREHGTGAGRGKLDDGDVAGQGADIIARDQLAAELVADLDGHDGPHERGNERYDDQRPDADIVHLAHGLPPVHGQVLRPG